MSAVPALPPRWTILAIVGWTLFWSLLAAIAVQDHWRNGHADLWRPLLWEGSSCLVVSALAFLQMRTLPWSDRWLAWPARWFAINLAPLPVMAPLFVAAVFALRHAVHDAVGVPYHHPPWGQVLLYESVKFALFYSLFTAVMFGIRAHAAMSAEQLRAQQALALSREAQLLQLAQQIEPHFLFNALNTIASTVHTDPQRADQLLVRLAALLRAATDLSRRPFCTLDEELALAEGYLAIMRERFADRLVVTLDVDERARGCRLPTLALQPLLENAFRHGVEREAGPAEVGLIARSDGRQLTLKVSCNLGVVAADKPDGVGLANLRQRLAAAHGQRARLQIEPGPDGQGSLVTMELPCVS